MRFKHSLSTYIFCVMSLWKCQKCLQPWSTGHTLLLCPLFPLSGVPHFSVLLFLCLVCLTSLSSFSSVWCASLLCPLVPLSGVPYFSVLLFLCMVCLTSLSLTYLRMLHQNRGTPLIMASQNGHLEVVQLLYREGKCNPHLKDEVSMCTD